MKLLRDNSFYSTHGAVNLTATIILQWRHVTQARVFPHPVIEEYEGVQPIDDMAIALLMGKVLVEGLDPRLKGLVPSLDVIPDAS